MTERSKDQIRYTQPGAACLQGTTCWTPLADCVLSGARGCSDMGRSAKVAVSIRDTIVKSRREEWDSPAV